MSACNNCSSRYVSHVNLNGIPAHAPHSPFNVLSSGRFVPTVIPKSSHPPSIGAPPELVQREVSCLSEPGRPVALFLPIGQYIYMYSCSCPLEAIINLVQASVLQLYPWHRRNAYVRWSALFRAVAGATITASRSTYFFLRHHYQRSKARCTPSGPLPPVLEDRCACAVANTDLGGVRILCRSAAKKQGSREGLCDLRAGASNLNT